MREATVTDQRNSAKQFQVLSHADGLGIAEVGCVCLVVWQAPVTLQRFQRQRDALAEIVGRYPRRAGFVCVIEPGTPVPDESLRKASIEMIAQHGRQLACVACVIEGDGFRASITRSVLSGMQILLPKRQTSVHFLATVAEAAVLTGRLCDQATRPDLVPARNALRRADSS